MEYSYVVEFNVSPATDYVEGSSDVPAGLYGEQGSCVERSSERNNVEGSSDVPAGLYGERGSCERRRRRFQRRSGRALWRAAFQRENDVVGSSDERCSWRAEFQWMLQGACSDPAKEPPTR